MNQQRAIVSDIEPSVAVEDSSEPRRVSSAKRFFRWIEFSSSFLLSASLHVLLLLLLAAIAWQKAFDDDSEFLILSTDTIGTESGETQLKLELSAPAMESLDLVKAQSADSLETIEAEQKIDVDSSLNRDLGILKKELKEDFQKSSTSVSSLLSHSLSVEIRDAFKATNKRDAVGDILKELIPPESEHSKKNQGSLRTKPKDGIKQASTVPGAVSGIFGSLESNVEECSLNGELWIVWMMDASLSLLEDRRQLAPLVFQFYSKLAERYPEKRQLRNGVFAFGVECVPIFVDKGIPNPEKMTRAILDVPIDSTGIENINSAILNVLESIPYRKKQRIEIVLWTDESGNDPKYLEDAVFVCKRRNAHIHVVGPLSVFGMQTGLQAWYLPDPWKSWILLPVDRGPDSCFAERARLPIWHGRSAIAWGKEAVVPVEAAKDGGPLRQFLLAPTGPYNLTRLALASGGSYQIMVREGELALPLGDRFADYLPDYRSAYEIAEDIDLYPLRRAIIASTAIINAREYWPRAVSFPVSYDSLFPYRPKESIYRDPRDFQQQLSTWVDFEYKKSVIDRTYVEKALQVLLLNHQFVSREGPEYSLERDYKTGTDAPGIPSLNYSDPVAYKEETSLRWKAWYDLNLGRLLAHSVRLHEYGLACRLAMSGDYIQERMLNDVNQLEFLPNWELLGGEHHLYRAKLAMELLARVENQHPNTQWAALAAMEKSVPMGFIVRHASIPPPPSGLGIPGGGGAVGPGTPSLPSM